jgi:hypothetical protein
VWIFVLQQLLWLRGTVFSKRIESLWHELGLGGDLDGVSSARDLWCLLADLGIDAEQSGTGLSAAFDAAGAFSGAAAWTVLTTSESLPVGVVEKTLDVLLDYSSQWADFLVTHWPIVIENWDDAATLMIDMEMNLFACRPSFSTLPSPFSMARPSSSTHSSTATLPPTYSWPLSKASLTVGMASPRPVLGSR